MSGKKPDMDLVARAVVAFESWKGRMPTGAGGLSRAELRMLERAGYVKGAKARLDSGTQITMWTWVGK
jgi:hypothetical protein